MNHTGLNSFSDGIPLQGSQTLVQIDTYERVALQLEFH